MFTLPYLITAPKLFQPGTTVTLGDMQMLRVVFFDVFFNLNAFAVHWPEVNELRATTRRLSEFEGILYGRLDDVQKGKEKLYVRPPLL